MANDDLYRSAHEARIGSASIEFDLQRFRRTRSAFDAEMAAVGFDTRTRNALLNSDAPFFGDLSDVLHTRRSELLRVAGIGSKAMKKIDDLAASAHSRDGHGETDAMTVWQLALNDIALRQKQARRGGHTSVANELALLAGLMEKRKPHA